MSYVRTSTANPLGHRPFNSRIPTQPPGMHQGFSLTPPNAPTFAQSAFSSAVPVNPLGPGANGNPTLKGYYRASFYEPDANSVIGLPPGVPSVAYTRALSGLGDYFPNYPTLRPTSHQTRDDMFSPVPRIYLPPEMIPVPGIDAGGMGFLGNDPGAIVPARHSNRVAAILQRSHAQTAHSIAAHHAAAIAGTYPGVTASRPAQASYPSHRAPANETAFEAHARRRQFSGGPFIANAANPRGVFFPAKPNLPRQFPAHSAPSVFATDPANPTGYFYPQTPPRVPLPATLRVVNRSWRGMTGLGNLGIAVRAPISVGGSVWGSPAPARPFIPAPTMPRPIAVEPQPVRPFIPVTGGGNIPRPPGGFSPGGHYIPGSGPTYPTGAVPIGGGSCQFTSSPESGGVVSVVPCDTIPGYSAGTSGSWSGGGGGGRRWWQPASSDWGVNNSSIAQTRANVAAAAANYPSALAQANAGTLPSNLSSFNQAQQNAILNAYSAATSGGTISSASVSGTPQQNAAYQIALAAAQNGTLTSTMLTGLTAAQQQAVISASQTSTAAQQAALQSGGASSAVPASTNGSSAAPEGDTQSLLDWLSQSTLISGVPNWGVAAVGGLAALWIMNRGKR